MNIIPRKKKYSPLESSNESTAAPCHGPVFIKRGRILLATFIRCFQETKDKREASEERETRTRRKRAEKLYALFVIRSTKERGKITATFTFCNVG